MPSVIIGKFEKYKHSLLRSETRGIPEFILRNCIRLDGKLCRSRIKYEINSLLRLTGLLLIAPTLFLLVNIGVFYFIDNYIVPLPMTIDIFSAFDIDQDVWEYNIEHEELGDVGQKYEQWSRKRGFSKTTSRFWQEHLWHTWFFYLFFLCYLISSFYIFVIKFCLNCFYKYHQRLISRHEAYYNFDLQTIPREKIIY